MLRAAAQPERCAARARWSPVAVFLSVNSESFPIADAILSTLYGLTAAEARVASEIGKGGILRDIGQRLHVSENTMKTHLKRIFDKTGVRRQSDLLSLVASLVPLNPTPRAPHRVCLYTSLKGLADVVFALSTRS